MTTMATLPAETVHVALGERAYDIVIGPGVLAGFGDALARIAPGAKAALVADGTVESLHGDAVRAALRGKVEVATTVVVPPGEDSKSFPEFERVVRALLDAGLERRDVVVALGGGVAGDLTGFAAAVLLRGVRHVQVPTTLLAQVDSAVGGKTGIDTAHGKNLVGAFHQPSLVLADTRLLDTLGERDFRTGYAEVAKYGLIDDAPFFAWLEGAWREVFSGGPARIRAIATSCRAKARIVADDERESGARALLNLGHTFAHALEAATGMSSRLVHGEAVSLGMVLAFGFSAELGLCDPQEEGRVARHLAAVGLPTKLSQVAGGLPGADRLVDLMRTDKKTEGGALTFILARGIGRCEVVKKVPGDAVRDFLLGRLDTP